MSWVNSSGRRGFGVDTSHAFVILSWRDKGDRMCVAVGVCAEDEDSLVCEATYKDPICENRCENKGIIREAIFLRRPTSVSCDMEWYTFERGIPGACRGIGL